MKTIRPPKRSVSPFTLAGEGGFVLPDTTPLETTLLTLENQLFPIFGSPHENIPKGFKTFDDLVFLPRAIRRISEAPANDAPLLLSLCHNLVHFRETVEQKGLLDTIEAAMKELFLQKVQLFMVDHYNEVNGPKDIVLFSKERDILIGNYFVPMAEAHPGRFSELMSSWMETENPDQLLHFLDFFAGSKNPTFEHYLLFTHPALGRILRDKLLLKSLFEKSAVLLKKITSPTWEKATRAALGV